MYRDVAQNPFGDYHFEMGRPLAERLGYDSADLDQIPVGSIDSFAGVGYFFSKAALQERWTSLE
jgi:arsenite methyltransferase